ncbi:hypothetical protein [Galactobacter valiniphilus]|uniref:hypothetical protein n=1 Tax=Galactobacter valiniphilus TaxID=2676122 RepID=UPI003735C272
MTVLSRMPTTVGHGLADQGSNSTGLGGEAVDGRLLGADELLASLALCRDWAAKKRLICSFAEQETMILDGVKSVGFAIFERRAASVIQGIVTVDEGHAPGLIQSNFLQHVLPRVEGYLGVKLDAIEVDFIADLG